MRNHYGTMRWLYVLALGLACGPGRADEAPADLAAQAGPILARYCARCHKGEGSESGYAFNVAHVPSLVEHSVVEAGKPDQSDLYNAIYRGRMPPRNQTTLPRPSAEEIELIKRWIAAGAPEFPKPQLRPPVALKTVLQTIKTHFDSIEPRERSLTRYFTLTHLHNDPGVDARHLRMVRAALAKTLNSLSWEADLVAPRAIDAQQTIYAVDLSQLGWTRDHWLTLVRDYPYGVGYGSHDDRDLRRLDDDLKRLAGGDAQLLLEGDDAGASLADLPEPVGETSRRFLLEPLDLATVAAELYETDAAGLKVQFEKDPVLRGTGLGVLRRDTGRIKRDAWESRAAFSLMQEVARQLGYTPR